MTVAALPSTVTYIEDGVTVAFPAPYRFRSASDLVVERIAGGIVTVLVLNVDYTVTGGTTDTGGTVTRAVATSGGRLRIRRRTALQQPMVYSSNDRFPAKSHEEALDRAMLIAQEQGAAIDDIVLRAPLAPIGGLGAGLFPTPNGLGGWELTPSGPGAPGPAGPVFVTLDAFRVAPVNNQRQSLKVPGIPPGDYFFETSNAPYVETLPDTILADGVSGSIGAWVRVRGTSISFDSVRSVGDRLDLDPQITDAKFAGGAQGDGIANNVAALSDALQPSNAGGKRVPAGIYSTTTVNVPLLPGQPHYLEGAGPGVSVLRKLNDDAAIVLDMIGAPDNLDNYTSIANLSLDNGYRGQNGTGIRQSNTARGAMRNLLLDGLGTGIYSRGGLLQTYINVTFRGCGFGYVMERGPSVGPLPGIYANMNKHIGGGAIGVTGIGYDLTQGTGFGLTSVNVELCGATGDMNTGGVRIRSLIAAETGFATMELNGHFERNKGAGAIFGSGVTGLVLHIRDSDFVSNEGARDINVSGAWSIGLTSNAANGVTNVQARNSWIFGGFYNTLNDTSDEWVHHTETATGKRTMWMSQFRINHSRSNPFDHDLLFGPAFKLTGGSPNVSMFFKYGPEPVVYQTTTGPKFSWSAAGVSFFGNLEQGQCAAIADPTDAGTTRTALIALLNYLRLRGDIAP